MSSAIQWERGGGENNDVSDDDVDDDKTLIEPDTKHLD